jgi:hypothetical protein
MAGYGTEIREKEQREEAIIRRRAYAALQEIKLARMLQIEGVDGNFGSAGAAMKAVMAERLAKFAIGTMRVARKKRMKIGAAAVVIAAEGV